jgi:hypothetical protein
MRSLVLADWNSSTLADSAIYSPEWDPSPDTMAAEVAPGVTKLNWGSSTVSVPIPRTRRFTDDQSGIDPSHPATAT